MKNTTVAYGEILLRLTPSTHGDLIDQSSSLNISFAGAESNILSNLSNLGHNATMISSLPNNSLGKSAIRFLRSFGLNTDFIEINQGRIGTFFIEHGLSSRGSQVIYDRIDSCFSKTKINESVWSTIFNNSKYFVITGVTPALSKNCQNNMLNAIKIAKSNNVKIVFDLNFRRNLWKPNEALEFISKIINDVDVLIGNIGSVSDIFGFKDNKVNSFSDLEKITYDASEFISDKYSFDLIAMTIRNQINATQNQLGGLIKIEDEYLYGKSYEMQIIDRLGGGDAFVSGILHGLLNNQKPQEIINFSNACFAITQTINGDINYFEERDIMEFSSDNYFGHIKR